MKKIKLTAIYDVSFPFVKGGGQRRFYEILKRFNFSKYHVQWLTFNAWDKNKEKIFKDGIEYVSLGNIPTLYNSSGKRSKIEPLIFAFCIILNLKKFSDSDFIWAGQWPLLHLLPLIILKPFFSYKLVVDYWEVWDLSYWKTYSPFLGYFGWFCQYLILFLISRFSIIVTDSNVEKNKIKKLIKSSRVEVISNGITMTKRDVNKNQASRTYDLVYFGRLKDHKNVELLIDSINYIKHRYSMSIKVVIIGDGPMKKTLQDKCMMLNLKNVIFTGFIDNQEKVYKYIKNSKLSVIPIISGGGAGNLTLLELMSCGTPCIIFDVDNGIDKKIIIDGVNGFLLKSLTFSSLGDKIFHYLINYETHKTMHLSTRDFSRNFTWDNSFLMYLKIFQAES